MALLRRLFSPKFCEWQFYKNERSFLSADAMNQSIKSRLWWKRLVEISSRNFLLNFTVNIINNKIQRQFHHRIKILSIYVQFLESITVSKITGSKLWIIFQEQVQGK